jgi:acylglycerol lipase
MTNTYEDESLDGAGGLKIFTGSFTLPLLIIHRTKDTVTRPEGSKKFYANAGSKDKTLKLYEGYFHDPLNEFGKEAVMSDIRGWIGSQL